MFAQQRLYLTADKAKLVHEGDDEAATLYASPGDEIPDSAAEKFGLVDGELPATGDTSKKKATPVKTSRTKAAKTGETKEAARGEDKSADGASGDGAAGGRAPAETKGE